MLTTGLFLAVAIAAPPPPPILPKGVPTELQGYNVEALYGAWSYAIPRAKGELTRQALAEPPVVAGFQARGRLLVMEGIDYDLGPDSASDMHRLCPVDPSAVPTGCITVLRWATIPETAWGDNDLTRWMKRNFNAQKLVRALKARSITPGSDPYSPPTRVAFTAFADPGPELKRLLQIRQVDSRTCPALAKASEALEGRKVAMTLDLAAIGETDDWPPPINPHAYRWVYTWSLVNDGRAKLSGEGDTSLAGTLAQPFREAAIACGIEKPEARITAD